MSEKRVIRIGTRESQLAMWQAKYVHALMTQSYPDIDFKIIGMTTMGDNDLIKPLSSFEGKGVFTKELDIALEANQIDAVVHCMKDLATLLPNGQQIFATMDRGIVEDCILLHPKYKDQFDALQEGDTVDSPISRAFQMLPEGAVIGTSALRRQATLKRFHPHLTFKDIRGNVGTRIAKLDSGDYDAIILARIGLERLELGHRISEVMDVNTYQHAVGQGALTILGRGGDDDIKELFKKVLDHNTSALECALERGMLATLNGGCKVPIAVSTQVLTLTSEDTEAFVASVDAARVAAREKLGVVTADSKNIQSIAEHVPTPRQTAVSDSSKCVITTRGSVMSVDGTSTIECSVVGVFENHPENSEANYKKAWEYGCQLGQALRSIGAEVILGDIRG